MEYAKYVCGNRAQNVWFLVLVVAGGLTANSLLFAPLHEAGHKHAANMQGIEATVIDRNHTQIAEFTPFNLAAGYYAETTLPLAITMVLLLFSSPRDAFIGILSVRKWYFHIGFFMGYATWSWLTPLIKHTTDFFIRPEWTEAMKNHWLYDPGLFLLSVWVIILTTRLRVRKNQDFGCFSVPKKNP